jgi:NAD(P)H-dependent FMN reductase
MNAVPVLLVVQHTPSPAVQAMLEAVLRGARHPEASDVSVLVRAALTAGPADVLGADAVLLGTPANIGYMSGALKHFLDQIYYPCLEVTVGKPYGVYVHGNDDTTGALAAIHRIVGALRWRQVAADVSVVGAPTKTDLEACTELGALLALTVSAA